MPILASLVPNLASLVAYATRDARFGTRDARIGTRDLQYTLPAACGGRSILVSKGMHLFKKSELKL